MKKVVLFTDKGVIHAGLVEYPLKLIEEMGIEAVVISDVPTEPTCDEAQILIDKFKKIGADFIIAIGGGSVIDVAKLTSVAATDTYTVRMLIEKPELASKYVRTLMIPTTAGTGAEATPNSIVAVPEEELKVGIVSEEMMADYVILDPQMVKSLPRKIAAATGVDALAHAIECFTSKKANVFSDTFALQALELIFQNIEDACDEAGSIEAKNAMLIASFYAGIAITTSGTTAVHALSYPLGGKYHIPHGIANAIMLMPVMRFNEPVCQELFAKIYDRVETDRKPISIEEKSKKMMERLQKIIEHLEIPTHLGEYGVSKADLETLVEAGMKVTRLLVNNRREVTEKEARMLYSEVL